MPALSSGPAMPQQAVSLPERFYQERFCAGLDTEIRVGQQRRADCISQTHAIEVVWHDEWKEGIGRALAYSAETGLLPGIVVVCRSDQAYCLKTSLLVRQTMTYHRIGGTLWDCLPINRRLSDCTEWDR
ncbi:MAG: hypothetical protein ACYC0C_15280 [Devosia sp.]